MEYVEQYSHVTTTAALHLCMSEGASFDLAPWIDADLFASDSDVVYFYSCQCSLQLVLVLQLLFCTRLFFHA